MGMDAQQQGSWLGRFYAEATRLAVRFPQATLALALLAAGMSIVYTGMNLGYRTSRHDLLDPESDYNRHWLEYIQEFGEDDDAVVVVDGANREQVVPVLPEISEQLTHQEQLFHAIMHEVDLSKVRSKGLHYVPPDDLQKLEGFLHQAGGIVNGGWDRLNLGQQLGGLSMQMEAQPAQAEAQLQRLTDSLLATVQQRPGIHTPWPEMPAAFGTLSELSTEYLLTNQGKLGFVLLRLSKSKDSFTGTSEATQALRELIARVQSRHPDVRVGLTGLPIMENDEMRASESSMMLASVVSLVGVTLLFIAGFGGVRHAAVATIVLLVGMAWSFGYVTLVVGHLNILSMSFTVTLIGIGIDYGIHYVARYLQLRGEGLDCETALIRSSAEVSPAITTGAVTTAIAFFAAALTSFLGIAELGIIAGGGILLCAMAELLVLPAAIHVMDREDRLKYIPRPLPVHSGINWMLNWPRVVLASTIIGTAALAGGLDRLWYDHNLLNMQPEGLESVELEQRLLAESNQSLWYALSIADSRDELLSLKEKFLALPAVERVEEIASLLPTDDAQRPAIERIHTLLRDLPERPPLIHVDHPEALGQVLGRLQMQAVRNPKLAKCAGQLEQIRQALRNMPPAVCIETLSKYQQQSAGELLSRLHVLQSMTNPEPPALADLPPSLVDRFVGHSGRYLLKIYGRGNIWDMQALQKFVEAVRSVDGAATGHPLQAFDAGLEMKQSYEQAAWYALVVILTVLMFDFRHLGHALLAAAPLAVEMVQMLGLMGLMDIPLNPANMIALPLIMGIGVDYGVHIVHDFATQRGPFRLTPSTAVAVTVDSLTTIVGFGSLMLASHQGLQSLGRVLVIGVTCCLFTSLVMLPAFLAWMTRLRTPNGLEESTPSTASTLPEHYEELALRLDSPHEVAAPHVQPKPPVAESAKPFSLR